MVAKPVPSAVESGRMKIYNHLCCHPRSGKRWLTFYSSWQTHRKGSSLALSFGATMTAVMDWKTQMKSGGATPKVAVSA